MTSLAELDDAIAAVGVRTIITQVQEIFREGGQSLTSPLRKAVACAVIRNPWSGAGFVEDLWPEMNRVGAALSEVLGHRAIQLLGGPDQIHGLGKCSVVGMASELEHGSGIIHGPRFGPRVREMVQGSAAIPFTERRSAPGVSISIPTAHKTRTAVRSYYQAVDLTLDDAPHPDEIAIAIAVVSGPRPHARIGDLTTDQDWATRS